MVKKGYWSLLPYSALAQLPQLKLSPAGVVPQRTRRPRPIIDYTFSNINANTVPLAPQNVLQLGHALQRILQKIAYANPAYGPPQLLKFDLADGYYRIRLTPSAALELGVVFPGIAPHSSIIGIPLSLPMGWNQSPPFFCAFTETAADLANAAIHSNTPLHPHPLESSSQQHNLPQAATFHPHIIRPPTLHLSQTPVAHVDVYIDDFLAVAQPTRKTTTLRALLHAISSIFRHHRHVDDSPARKNTISNSKLQAGDGAWSTSKTVLGWLIDTEAGTIQLPPIKADRLHTLLHHFSLLHRTSRRKWYSLLGELRHMSMAIHGARYLFSILQSVLVDQPQARRIRLSPLIHEALGDWMALAFSLATRPVPITALVPRAPSYVGATDASIHGIGGFWLPTAWSSHSKPIVFRYPFPPWVQQRLVSATNPFGDITNSDLELCALILASATLAQNVPLANGAIWCGSDNTAAVGWTLRGSTSSTNINAYLLRLLAPLTRTGQFTLVPHYVKGLTNTVADFCSRSFSLCDAAFLQDFQTRYPITPSWTYAHPPNETVSAVTSALCKTPSAWASVLPEAAHATPVGTSGYNFATPSTSTPHSPTLPTPSQFSKFSPTATAWDNYLPVALRSAAERWAMPFVPLGRRYPNWDSPTPAYCPPVN